MRGWLLFAVLWLAPGMALAQSRTPTITAPDWAEMPTADMLTENYPKLAAFLDQGGRAVITCAVTAEGRLKDCTVDSETPSEMGFGAAAIRMSRAFRMRPQTVDGKPVEGVVCIPLRFVLPPLPQGAPPPAASVTIAERIVDSMGLTESFLAAHEAELSAAERSATPSVPQAPRTAAATAVRTAIGERRAEVRLALATSLAEVYSAADLSWIVAFAESPAAALLRGGEDVGASMDFSDARMGQIVLAELRTAICERLRCQATPEETQLVASRNAAAEEVTTWTVTPSEARLARVTPRLAGALGVPGSARLTCRTTAEGKLTGCSVDAEAPAGWTFGKAALQLATAYEAPAGVDASVTVRVSFPAAPITPVATKPRSAPPAASAAARDLVMTFQPMQQMTEQLEPQLSQMAAGLAAQYDAATARAIEDGVRVAMRRTVDRVVDEIADALATKYSQAQIAEVTRFLANPTTQALMKPRPTGESPAMARLSSQVAADARTIYCGAHDCTAPPPPGTGRDSPAPSARTP